MSAHRALRDLYRAFDEVGPGILEDPGDGGTITPDAQFQICEMESESAETRTLSNPTRAGIRFILRLHSDGGDVVVTASNGFDQNGATQATFADAGDMLSLVSVSHTVSGEYRWEAMEGNVGSVTTLVSSSPSSSPSASSSSSPSSSPSASSSSSPSASVSASPSSSPSASSSSSPSSSPSATA